MFDLQAIVPNAVQIKFCDIKCYFRPFQKWRGTLYSDIIVFFLFLLVFHAKSGTTKKESRLTIANLCLI